MVLKIFTVFDSKVGAYKQPLFMRSSGEALRSIMECVSDNNHPFSKYSEDYTLFELGEYDDDSAAFDLHPTPKSIARLNELKARPDSLKAVNN